MILGLALSGGDIAAIVTAGSGIVVGIITTRYQRKDTKTSNQTNEHIAVLDGYANIVHDLQQELIRVRKQYLEDTHAFELEKDRLIQHISSLEEEVAMWKEKVMRIKYEDGHQQKS